MAWHHRIANVFRSRKLSRHLNDELATCFLFGLAPVLRATKSASADAVPGGRGSAFSAERNGLRRALVVSQVALSLVLLVGALLFGQSLSNLLQT